MNAAPRFRRPLARQGGVGFGYVEHIYAIMWYVKRTTVFLPEELHERLRQEAFAARVSMAQVIRRRLESGARRRKSACADPLAKVEAIVSDGHLTAAIDESLYSS